MRPPFFVDHDHAVACGLEQYHDQCTGYLVFTEPALLAVGACCASGCRHCPFGHVAVSPKWKKARDYAPTWFGSVNVCSFSRAPEPKRVMISSTAECWPQVRAAGGSLLVVPSECEEQAVALLDRLGLTRLLRAPWAARRLGVKPTSGKNSEI